MTRTYSLEDAPTVCGFIALYPDLIECPHSRKVVTLQAVTNPDTPNAGAEPQAVVGRDDQLGSFDLLLGRISRGRTGQSMIITGLRGAGKTVLLEQFRTKALSRDWVVVEFEVSKNDDSHFRRTIGAKLRTSLHELSP